MRKLTVRLAVAAVTFAVGIALTTPFLVRRSTDIFYQLAQSAKIAPPTPSAETAKPSSLEQTIGKLRQFETVNEDIPTAARPLLTRLKHQLRDFINNIINAKESHGESAESIQATARTYLRNRRVTVKDSDDEDASANSLESHYAYGDVYEISIRQVPSQPELLAATTTIGVRCGNDTSLYLFKRFGDHWELVLAQEANNYEDVSGAQGMFDYAISPPDAQNNFFVVTTNVSPWCTSNWQSIRYAVLRVGPDAYRPPIMANGQEDIYLGVEEPYKLDVGRDWFSINFEGDASHEEITNGETSSKHVVKYTINGEKVINLSK